MQLPNSICSKTSNRSSLECIFLNNLCFSYVQEIASVSLPARIFDPRLLSRAPASVLLNQDLPYEEQKVSRRQSTLEHLQFLTTGFYPDVSALTRVGKFYLLGAYGLEQSYAKARELLERAIKVPCFSECHFPPRFSCTLHYTESLTLVAHTFLLPTFLDSN